MGLDSLARFARFKKDICTHQHVEKFLRPLYCKYHKHQGYKRTWLQKECVRENNNNFVKKNFERFQNTIGTHILKVYTARM